MKLKTLAIAAFLLANLAPLTARAENEADLNFSCSRFAQNHDCEAYVSKNKDNSSNVDPKTGFPIVESAILTTEDDLPYSTPVVVKDPEGDYVAVIDQDYETNLDPALAVRVPGMLSNWSRKYVRIYGMQKRCKVNILLPIFVRNRCNNRDRVFSVDLVQIKIERQIFQLQGDNSKFLVDDRLALALRDAQPDKVLVRFFSSEVGNTGTRSIGKKTIAAWKTIYQDVPAVPGESTSSVRPAPQATSSNSNLTAVDGSTWRTDIDRKNYWSVPVLIRDEFDGDYVAVLDRNYSKGSGVISNWSRQFIWIHVYKSKKHGRQLSTLGVGSMEIKIGDRSFQLTGRDNQFAVSEELASALQKAEGSKAFISFTDPDGKVQTYEIGEQTIAAWKVVYGDNRSSN